MVDIESDTIFPASPKVIANGHTNDTAPKSTFAIRFIFASAFFSLTYAVTISV